MARPRRPEKPQTHVHQEESFKGLHDVHTKVEPYYKHIGIGIGVAVFVVIIVQVFSYYSASYQRGGWALYFAATSPSNLAADPPSKDKLTEVAEQYPQSTAAMWSKLLMADELFAAGASQLIQDRSEALSKLNDASDLYAEVAKETEGRLQQVGFKLLHLRALLGQGKSQEAIGKSTSIEQAIAFYAQVEKELGSPYALEARRRRETLQRESTREFYAQLAEVKPQVAPPPLDLDSEDPFKSPLGLPSQGPNLPEIDLSPDSMDLPGFPDFSAEPAKKEESNTKEESKEEPSDEEATKKPEEKTEPADDEGNPEQE